MIASKLKLEKILQLLVVAGIVFRFIAVLYDGPQEHLFSDPKRHWENGGLLLTQHLMGGLDPIGYQVYLFALRALTGDSKIGISILSGLLSCVMPWIYFFAARSLGMDRLPALIVLALITWLPSFVSIYSFFMTETLLLVMIGFGLWSTGRALNEGTTAAFVVMTATWTIAVLVKTLAVPAAVAAGIFCIIRQPKKVHCALMAVAVGCVFLAPNYLRTRHILGFGAPFGSDYIVRLQQKSDATTIRVLFNNAGVQFSSPSCYVAPLEPLTSWMIGRAYEDTVCEVHINEKRGRVDWCVALAGIHRPMSIWLRQWGENVILFMFAPSWPDSNVKTPLGWLNYILRWMWAPLIFQTLIGNASLFVRRRFDLIPVLVTASVLAVMLQNVVTMEGRYRKPFEPLIILNIVWLLSKREQKESDNPRMKWQA